MSLAKVLGIFAVVLLLLPTIGAANVVISAEQTVLDGQYVSDTLEDEDVYEEISEQATSEIDSDLSSVEPSQSDKLPEEVEVADFNTTAIVEAAITEDYVADQSEENILELYDYLHGESDSLDLVLNVEPVKENIAEEVAEQAASVETEELIRSYADELGNTEVPVDGATATRMLESQSSYQQVKSDFRAQVRERVREETGASGDELERQVDQALSQMAQRTKSNINSTMHQETSELPSNVTNATIGLQHAFVDGLTTDASYEEFTQQIEANEQTMAQTASELALQQMDSEVQDEYSLTQEMGNELESQLRGAQGTVQQVDLMSIVIPIFGLLLIAAVFGLTRSLWTTGKVAGGVLLFAGFVGFIVPTIMQGTIVDFVEGKIATEDAPAVGDAVVAIIDGVLGTLAAQSLAMLVGGLLLVVLAFAGSAGYLDGLKKQVA